MMAYGQVNADVIGTSVAGSNLGAGNASLMKSRIINGAMTIDQRNAGASVAVTATNTFVVDRFYVYGSQSSKLTAQQNAGSVTPPTGFSKYLGFTSLSAYSVLAADIFYTAQKIEGFNTADLGWGTASAKTVTLSFQVYSSLTGTFGGSINNEGSNYCYPFTYSIPVANTWTTISITVAGPTAGTWAGATNGIGLYVSFGLGVGSTSSGTAGAWASGTYFSATGATSVVGTSGATFYITGVQLEVGSSATGFEYRQYGQELALCQRYYQRYNAGPAYTVYGYGTGYNATIINAFKPLQTPMRATPTTLDIASVGSYKFDSGASSYTITAISLNTSYINANYLALDVTISSGGVAGQSYIFASLNNTSSYIGVGAEL